MSWKMYRWVWQLRSPLHVGRTPAGALNRTRLYIPARTVWGAVTAELARSQSLSFPNYQAVGKRLQQEARFSYLFPAQQVDGEWKAWLPQYQEGKGLMWKREDGGDELKERPFRQRLLSTRPSTAIEPASDSAEEGTLREFEVINPYWRGDNGSPEPVAMVGYLFFKEDGLKNDLDSVQEIFVGGDTRYGLGHLVRVDFYDAGHSFFSGAVVTLDVLTPIIQIAYALAHTLPSLPLKAYGALECIAGWDMVTGGLKRGELAWVPGSCWRANQKFIIQEDGLWQVEGV